MMRKITNYFSRRNQSVKLTPRLLLGAVAALLASGAQAGTESQKLINVLNITDSGTFVSVLSPGPSAQECFLSIISVNKDANYDARIAMLLAAKLVSTPVTIVYTISGGGCLLTSVQVQ